MARRFKSTKPSCLAACSLHAPIQLTLKGPLDEVRAKYPAVTIAACIDDINLQRRGGGKHVIDNVSGAGVTSAHLLKKVDVIIDLDKTRER